MNSASHWAPPTVEQEGAVGANGGNHWIIEDNIVLYAKAVCISIGMPSGPADEADSGHHVVRNNVIMRCGQAGVAGQRWNSNSVIADNSIEDINYRVEFGGAETGGIKLHQSHHTLIDHNLIRNVDTLDRTLANGDAIWLDAGNFDDTVRNNVITGAMGNSILMEANWIGRNVIENNIVVGGRVATYSSRDAVWKYNLFFDVIGSWVNQVDLHRPSIAGGMWSRNLFINRGLEDSPDATQENLYLGTALPRDGETGAITDRVDAHFKLHVDDTVVTAIFDIDRATYCRSLGWASEDLDFYGHSRTKDKFSFGPFANVVKGKNVMTVFAYNPRRSEATEILTCGVKCGRALTTISAQRFGGHL
jgi:hypothetical protein